MEGGDQEEVSRNRPRYNHYNMEQKKRTDHDAFHLIRLAKTDQPSQYPAVSGITLRRHHSALAEFQFQMVGRCPIVNTSTRPGRRKMTKLAFLGPRPERHVGNTDRELTIGALSRRLKNIGNECEFFGGATSHVAKSLEAAGVIQRKTPALKRAQGFSVIREVRSWTYERINFLLKRVPVPSNAEPNSIMLLGSGMPGEFVGELVGELTGLEVTPPASVNAVS
jgi:hypothetical protein